MLELGNCDRQPFRLLRFVGDVHRRQRSRTAAPGGGRSGRAAGRAIGVHRLKYPGVLGDRLVGGEQVREHHGAGEVGDVLLADSPAALGLAHDHIVNLPRFVRPVFGHTCPALPRLATTGHQQHTIRTTRRTPNSIREQIRMRGRAYPGPFGMIDFYCGSSALPQPVGLASCASFFCTWAADGLHIVEPSPNNRVGTVWLPPLTLITNSAAAGSSSMSTSVTSIPARPSCRLRFLQNPHQVVVYIVSGTGDLLIVLGPTAFWGQQPALRGSSGACNNFCRPALP